MIYDMNNLKNLVKQDGLQVCVTSYGGSCTNALCDILNECGIVTNTPVWGSMLCHSPCYIELGIPIIYLYDHPVKSFMSVKRRGKLIQMNYAKMTNNLDNIREAIRKAEEKTKTLEGERKDRLQKAIDRYKTRQKRANLELEKQQALSQSRAK
jgi:hypothetical protein